MRTIGALLFIALGACFQVGCEVPAACTLIGCSDHVTFVVKGAGDAFTAELPVVIDACVGSKCGVFDLVEENGKIVCHGPGESQCQLEDDGDLVFDFNTSVEDQVTAKITVTNGAGTDLFSGTQDIQTEDQYPNGEACGAACRAGEAEFVPM